MTQIEEVLVVGAGTMGRQVALQCAMCGYRVSVYDNSLSALKQARAAIDLQARALSGVYVADAASTITGRIFYSGDLSEVGGAADLVSENLPEDPVIKGQVLAEAHAVVPEHAILTTNTSTLVPSMIAVHTGRPQRFLALHFHQVVWETGLVDIVAHPGVTNGIVEVLVAFAHSIRQVPIVSRKESRGYVFNFMLRAYLNAALQLWADDVADIEDIDRAWMLVHKSGQGPFGAMDVIGLDVMLEILRVWRPDDADPAIIERVETFLEESVARGAVGAKAGRGFYSYPDPAYTRPDFLDSQYSAGPRVKSDSRGRDGR